ncbi:MAG: Methyltransferase type 11 [archaeon GW2011_AR20]|nr:MAG: Methyltransferase type 11 [archaeon GW2011_AR20]AQS28211.1 hypothetical protein [uncultured archaeon]MBS3160493.1 class I SAM-dependent methyltransferase [Candidatus Woesearchaeota archaeon]
MKCAQLYLDKGCFLEALQNLTNEIAVYLYREESFLLNYIKRGDFILDVGCGNGRASFYLARKVGLEGKIFAIDNNKSMLERASEEIKIFRNIELHQINAKKTPFNTSYFGVSVITFNTLGNLEEDERSIILNELHRITKPKGIIIGTVYSENASDAQKEMYEGADLKVDKIDDDFVYVSEIEFKGERFTKDKLRKILLNISPNIKIKKICDIAYGFSVEVNKNV